MPHPQPLLAAGDGQILPTKITAVHSAIANNSQNIRQRLLIFCQPYLAAAVAALQYAGLRSTGAKIAPPPQNITQSAAGASMPNVILEVSNSCFRSSRRSANNPVLSMPFGLPGA